MGTITKNHQKNMDLIIKAMNPVNELNRLGYSSPYEIIEPNLKNKNCNKLISIIFTNLKNISNVYHNNILILLSQKGVSEVLLNTYNKCYKNNYPQIE